MTPMDTWFNNDINLPEISEDNERGNYYCSYYVNVNIYNMVGKLDLVFTKTDSFKLTGIDFIYTAPSYEEYSSILTELSNTYGEYTTEVLSENETAYTFTATDYEVKFKELLETDDIANTKLYITFSYFIILTYMI